MLESPLLISIAGVGLPPPLLHNNEIYIGIAVFGGNEGWNKRAVGLCYEGGDPLGSLLRVYLPIIPRDFTWPQTPSGLGDYWSFALMTRINALELVGPELEDVKTRIRTEAALERDRANKELATPMRLITKGDDFDTMALAVMTMADSWAKVC